MVLRGCPNELSNHLLNLRWNGVTGYRTTTTVQWA